MIILNANKSSRPYKKQKGATLFTSLIFLILMTIVSVSAAKISIMDILVSGNDEQQMLLFQETENDLKELTTPVELITTLVAEGSGVPWVYNYPDNVDKPGNSEKITNRDIEYYCGGFNGLATSQGPDVPPCFLFDFEVSSGKLNTGVRDKHNRGAGKEFPNATRNSALNN